MRVSELVIVVGSVAVAEMNPHKVETRSDALQIISNEFQLASFIEQFGDVAVEFDKDANVWRVPEFSGVIARYSAAKQIECDRWGCE